MNDEQANHRRAIARRRRFAGVLVSLVATTIAGALLTAAPALAGECANEQLRLENNSTQLPECRAYELVTDPFKEGFAPVGPFSFTDDGSFAYQSSGNFAGDGLGATFNNYVAARSETGWLTTSVNPSGPMFAAGSFNAQGLSTDLRSALWLLRLPDESTELQSYYLREPDGTFARIGPVLNPATVPPGAPGTGGPISNPSTEATSADLSHVVFDIEGQGAFPGPGPYEYVGTGNERPRLVAVDNEGNLLSAGHTCTDGMSTDGRVVFVTPGCGGQVWARISETTSIDASASDCTRASGDPGGACNGPAQATYAGSASNGSRVFFTTPQQLVNGDTNQTNDLYACDIPPGTPTPVGLANPCESLTEVSGSSANANVEDVVGVSTDGSRVYFVASGVLAANADALGEPAVSGDHNLYVSQIDSAHPAGQTKFVAKLQSNDVSAAQTTADGRYLVFATANQLLPSDTDEVADVYRYDADTGLLLRLSTDTSGSGGNELGVEVTLQPNAMSADGSTVVFQTNEALSPADTNGTRDVYEWHEGRVSLISSGQPSLEHSTEAHFVGISPSGTDIYFTMTAQLTPNDGNTDPDVYDARIDGGFSVAPPQQCSGEACQGPAAQQSPSPGASASATFNGPGSPVPAETRPASASKPKPLTRAQKLAKALKACKSKRNQRKRSACEKKARRTYGSAK
jgi:hypothetical protein